MYLSNVGMNSGGMVFIFVLDRVRLRVAADEVREPEDGTSRRKVASLRRW